MSDKLTPAKITLNPSLTDGKNDWYKQSVEVTITTVDNKAIHYRLVKNGITAENEADIAYTSAFTIENLGQTAIYAWTVDGEENSGETSETIKIDNQAPTIQNPPAITTSKELVNNWYRAGLSIEILGEDEHSGISGYYYMIKGESTEWKRRDISQKMIIGENDREGITEIAIKAVDNAGNESNEITINIQKDTRAPEFQTDIVVTNVTKTGFTARTRAIDKIPGSTMLGEDITYRCYVTEVGTKNKIEIGGGTPNTTGVFTASGLKEDAMYDVDIVAYDPAGNEATRAGIAGTGTQGGMQGGGDNPTPTQDPNAPNPNAPMIKLSGTMGNNNIYTSEVTITITAPTGVTKFGYEQNGEQNTHEGMIHSFNVTDDGVYTIDAYTLDSSGNQTDTKNSASFMIDRTPPEIALTIGEVGTSIINVSASAQDASGVASYRYDYKETDGEWHEGEETNSSNYIFEGLKEQTRYYVRAYIVDNAGNGGFSEELSVRTKLTEKNPGGEITDITTDEIIVPGANSSLILTNVGKTINYTYTPKTITFSAELSGSSTQYIAKEGAKWYVLAEDSNNIYIIAKGQGLTLNGVNGYNNGVGLLDSICDSCYKNDDYIGISARNIKIHDFIKDAKGTAPKLSGPRKITSSGMFAPQITTKFDHLHASKLGVHQSMQPEIYKDTEFWTQGTLTTGYFDTYRIDYQAATQYINLYNTIIPDVSARGIWISTRVTSSWVDEAFKLCIGKDVQSGSGRVCDV